MPNQMTIEQAAEYLREKMPRGFSWGIEIFLSSQYTAAGVRYKVEVYSGFGNNIFSSRESLSNPVRAAADWAKGQEAGNV